MKRTAAKSYVFGLGLLEGQMAHGPPICSWLDDRPVGRRSFVACIASLEFGQRFLCHQGRIVAHSAQCSGQGVECVVMQ